MVRRDDLYASGAQITRNANAEQQVAIPHLPKPELADADAVSRTRFPNRRFQFHKRSQLFIRSHNETLSVAAMCVSNPDCSSFFIHRCVHRQLRSLLNLRNYSQGKVVAIAALVAHLVGVAVTGEDRAVRKITECACNRCRRRIVDYRENCTRCEGATSKISKGKLRATVNGHPVGDHLIGGGVAAVHVHIVGSVDAKGQRTLDGKGAGAAEAMYIPGG